MTTNIKANNTLELIKEGAQIGKKVVKVVFYPAFDKTKHSNLPAHLIKLLKKSKTETFDIIGESLQIISLKNSTDVKSIKWN
jgi:hypothetical protein